MAALGSVITLSDRIKRQDPDGKIAGIVNLLSQSNNILMDMHVKEANRTTGEQITQVTSLPTVDFRAYNEGAAVGKMTTAQITEECALLEAWSRVDEKLVELEADQAAFRMSEAQGFLEAMAQKMAGELFYGNQGGPNLGLASSGNPGTSVKGLKGLSARYADDSLNNGQNVLKAGGAGADNSSVWLVGWGPNTVYGFYPKGSSVGLRHRDHGLRSYNTSTGLSSATLAVYEDQFQWEMGLAVKDWRYCVRIPNIDISALTSKSSAAPLIDLMIKAIHRIPNLSACRPVFYCNRTVFQMLDIYTKDEAVGTVSTTTHSTTSNASGIVSASTQPVTMFRGIPVRLVDQLTETEQLAV